MISQILLGLAIAWLMYNIICFALKYSDARKSEIPIVASPVGQMNVFWVILQPVLVPLLRRLPFRLGSFTRYCSRGWAFYDKCNMHLELGDAWVLVTPSANWLYLSDADAVKDILSRRRDFIKPVSIYKMLEIFGPNVLTVEGEDWQRQRKITTPPFNEKNNNLVWVESLRQTSDMLRYWAQHDHKGVCSTVQDTKILTLNVLARAGLGQVHSFQSAIDPQETVTDMNYRDSMSTILQNAVLVMLLPPRLLSLPFLPERLVRTGNAIVAFKKYMSEMLNEEKNSVHQRKPGGGNLMSSLVRASEEASQTTSQHGPVGLTMDEIFGNMFIFNSAGHETTANTLSYGILLLAAHPEWQKWIAEEIQHVLTDGRCETWNYEDVFPRLKRCRAIMFETLRLFPPVLSIPKYTGDQDQHLTINNKNHLIPAKTLILPNSTALHTHPRYWGEDALTWRPSRWIVPSTEQSNGASLKFSEEESLRVPMQGTFVPWSDGARVCPGKKFAQVEFVAVITALFRTYHVNPIVHPGEDIGHARQRILHMVMDSNMGFLLQIRNPTSVSLKWTPI